MTAYATLTGNVRDLGSQIFSAKATKVWIESNVPGGVIADQDAEQLLLGTRSYVRVDGADGVEDDGSFSFTVVATGSDDIPIDNPEDLQYRVWVDFGQKFDRSRQKKKFGWYAVPANADITALVPAQQLEPTWQGSLDAAVAGLVPAGQFATALSGAIEAYLDDNPPAGGGAEGFAPLGRVWKAEKSVFMLALYGMSISSFDASPMQVAAAELCRRYGRGCYVFVQAGLLGGSYTEPSNGWYKQWYGGPGYIRARGDSSSDDLTFDFYGDTYDVVFSRESNSTAVNVKIDGVTVDTSPAAGSQAYNQHVTGTVTKGAHRLTIENPGSGYTYLEYVLLYDSTQPGVIVLNFALGGSLYSNMETLMTPTGSQVPGIAVVNDNGVKAHYYRGDIDLYINGHDVNDVFQASTFLSLLPKAISYVEYVGRHLINISSMAGHFAKTGEPGHDAYASFRAAYAAAAAASGNISHVDWHGATVLTQDEVDDGTYHDRYYPDDDPDGFIHPTQPTDEYPTSGYQMGVALLCRTLGITPPVESYASVIDNNAIRRPVRIPLVTKVATVVRRIAKTWSTDVATDVVTLPRAHGLGINDRIGLARGGSWQDPLRIKPVLWVKTTPAFNQLTLSTTQGGSTFNIGGSDLVDDPKPSTVLRAANLTPAGYAQKLLTGASYSVVPYYLDPDAFNLLDDYNLSIQASSDSDAYGKYLTAVGANIYPDVGLEVTNEVSTVTFRASGQVSVRAGGNTWRVCGPDGTRTPTGGASDLITVIPPLYDSPEPKIYTVHIIDPTGDNAFILLSAAKVYSLCWTFGDLSILNG